MPAEPLDAMRVADLDVGRYWPHGAGPGIGLRFVSTDADAEVLFVMADELALSMVVRILWQLGVDPRTLPAEPHQLGDDNEREG